jgi:tetratricopeptide (TPR) repeat protein
LAETDAERFEEHYFECPVCLEQLESLQAVRVQLARNPVPVVPLAASRVLAWPSWGRAAAVAAAVLVAGLVGLRIFVHPATSPAGTGKVPAQSLPAAKPLQPAAAPAPALAQLADMAAPAYVAMALRGESRDAHFESGMQAYQAGNWSRALEDLKQVPTQSLDGLAARFYLGACQMQLGQFDRAAASLRSVAGSEDAPEQESALYYLAQIALREQRMSLARQYLTRTIALHGDLELRARDQQRRVAEWTRRQQGRNDPAASR